MLLADDDAYAFVEAVNPSDAPRAFGPLRVALSGGPTEVARFQVAPRSQRLVPVGLAPPARKSSGVATMPASATPPPFAPASTQVLDNGRVRVALAPDAGARISELTAPGFDNAATSIGLLRDAVSPEPATSPRDYIGAYTHPLAAGTFNRPYACTPAPATTATSSMTCVYDAPDLPAGGARFARTLSLAGDGNEVAVEERFTPVDPASTSTLKSVSGFAFHTGDVLIAPDGTNAVGILHGRRFATLGWRSGDVNRVTLKQTRGAELVTLILARPIVELRLGLYEADDAAEAARLLQANPR